jgi:hypothetical protein
MTGIFKQILIGCAIGCAIGWAAPAPMAGEIICEDEGAFIQAGTSSHKGCIAKHLPEFSDYENRVLECRLVVYLTNLEQKETAKKILRPGYEQHIKNPRRRALCTRPKIEFRQARYPYSDMAEWQTIANEMLRDVDAGSFPNATFWDQRLDIGVRSDNAMAKANEILADHGVPSDAYNLRSTETEIRETRSIAPAVHASAAGEEVQLPIVLWSNEDAGVLVFGHTTMRQATRMLPAWPGDGPSKQSPASRSERTPWTSEEMHAALDNLRYGYNPAQTSVFIGFDKKKRLIFAEYEMQEGQGAKLLDAVSELASLEDIYRDNNILVQRARIGSCVIADMVASRLWDGTFRVFSVVYLYMCDPVRKK